MIVPGAERKLVGKGAMVESYREFLGRATIEAFETIEKSIDVFGDTAVTLVKWRMRWTSEGEPHDDTGRELLVLVDREGEWKIAWRTMM